MDDATGPPGISGDHRMPRAAFVDDQVFAAERAALFTGSWQLVGHESEIPEAGDYVRRRLFTDDVIVTRTRDGDVRVLLNSCAHRGTQLCRGTAGNTSTFRCSYHGWTYDGTGRLIGVPALKTSYPEDFDKDGHSLVRAEVTSFHGLLFAAWAPDRPLEASLGEFAWYLEALLSVTSSGWSVYGPPVHYGRQGNWKLDTENFAGDGYHLTTAHRSMYDEGVMGRDAESERKVIGHCVATAEGNTLRTVHLTGPDGVDGPNYLGFPPSHFGEITANLGPERAALLDRNTVVHGNIFPNTCFIKVSLGSVGDEEEDDWTAFVMFRTPLPDSPHTSTLYQWVLVPNDYPQAWKDRSYKFAMRSHGPAQVFEVDDLENFARIDTAISGIRSRRGTFDYNLGDGTAGEEPGWAGPGDVDPQNLSEHNQRAFYARWSELVGAAR